MLQYPTDGASTEDEIVAEFCKEQLYGDSQKEAYIELPDWFLQPWPSYILTKVNVNLLQFGWECKKKKKKNEKLEGKKNTESCKWSWK